MNPLVISLCDYTGHMVAPWVEAGYDAILVDPQHGETHQEGPILKLATTVQGAMPTLGQVFRERDVAAVFGFPPCTNLAVSGAKHFERKMTDKEWKHYAGPNMYFDAVRVAWQCEIVGMLSGAPWFVENPVSRLSTFWRKPDHTFSPHQFTAFESGDNYTKKTCLWTGGGFVMPHQQVDPTLGEPDDRIHKASPGPDRENFRSATPMGFARAVFAANISVAREAAA